MELNKFQIPHESNVQHQEIEYTEFLRVAQSIQHNRKPYYNVMIQFRSFDHCSFKMARLNICEGTKRLTAFQRKYLLRYCSYVYDYEED